MLPHLDIHISLTCTKADREHTPDLMHTRIHTQSLKHKRTHTAYVVQDKRTHTRSRAHAHEPQHPSPQAAQGKASPQRAVCGGGGGADLTLAAVWYVLAFQWINPSPDRFFVCESAHCRSDVTGSPANSRTLYVRISHTSVDLQPSRALPKLPVDMGFALLRPYSNFQSMWNFY